MNALIFMKENDLRPTGGPSGFCYNIFREIKRKNIGGIEFLPADDAKHAMQVSIYRKITNFLPKWVNAVQIAYRRKKDYQTMIKTPVCHGIDFSRYDAIHFHSTIALYKYRKDLENYSGKVLLTTHSPVPQHMEIYMELPTEVEKKIYKNFYAHLDVIDEYAFNRADYVVFPCEEAEESYLKNWKKYAEIRTKLKSEGKLVYIPTGIEPKKVQKDREQICSELSLNKESFIISYAGRHNQVKGYDLLQKLAMDLWNRGNEFPFIICGRESPIQGLRDKRWNEVGWTNDTQSYIAASDAFVLPNRETYFDIIMLEVLSCGKIVVASKTGGNKYFDKIGAKGVFLYETTDEAVRIIESISAMSRQKREQLEDSNRELFNRLFTTDKYVVKYQDFLNTI